MSRLQADDSIADSEVDFSLEERRRLLIAVKGPPMQWNYNYNFGGYEIANFYSRFGVRPQTTIPTHLKSERERRHEFYTHQNTA
jgi:hypothetical protein